MATRKIWKATSASSSARKARKPYTRKYFQRRDCIHVSIDAVNINAACFNIGVDILYASCPYVTAGVLSGSFDLTYNSSLGTFSDNGWSYDETNGMKYDRHNGGTGCTSLHTAGYLDTFRIEVHAGLLVIKCTAGVSATRTELFSCSYTVCECLSLPAGIQTVGNSFTSYAGHGGKDGTITIWA